MSPLIILLILFIFMIIITFRNKECFSTLLWVNTDNITYTLGIPSIPQDIIHFRNLINNINKQTLLPNDIIIALSETTDTASKKIETELNNISKVPVKISNTIDKAYAGINRNRVASESTSEYIIFLDADDFMHPQRIEIVDKVLKKNNKPVGLIHGLKLENDNSDIKFDNWVVWGGKELYNFHKNIIPESKSFWFNTINVAHGHAVYARKVFNDVKYTDMKRGEDVRMVRDVLNFYGDTNNNLNFLNLPLINYYPRKYGL